MAEDQRLNSRPSRIHKYRDNFLNLFLFHVSNPTKEVNTKKGEKTMQHPLHKAKYFTLAGVIALTFFAVSTLAWAKSDQNRQRMREKFETLKIWKIMDALNLNSQTALKIFPVIREMDEKKMNLREKQRNLMQKIGDLSKGTDNSAGNVGTLANQIFDINEQIAALPREEFKKLKGILTEKQLAQYILFQQHFRKEFIRQWLRGKRDRRFPRNRQGSVMDRRQGRRPLPPQGQ
jgi:hypothetical protein